MTKRQKDKKDQKQSRILWCQGSFALLRCFHIESTCFWRSSLDLSGPSPKELQEQYIKDLRRNQDKNGSSQCLGDDQQRKDLSWHDWDDSSALLRLRLPRSQTSLILKDSKSNLTLGKWDTRPWVVDHVFKGLVNLIVVFYLLTKLLQKS